MNNIIEIKGKYSDEFVLLHYKNIICLAEMKWIYNQNLIQYKIYFYDINKEKKINLYGWDEILNNYLILNVYPIKDCIFILAEYSKKNILICLDFKNQVYKECLIPYKMSMKCDGKNIYLESLIKKCDYYIVNYNSLELSIMKLNFFNGKIDIFDINYLYKNLLIFTISGEDIAVLDKNAELIQKLSAFQTLLCYNGNSIKIIDTNNDKNLLLNYISTVDNIIYYTYLKNETSKDIYCYNLSNNKKSKVLLNKKEYPVSSGKEIYLYTKHYIKRISDNKIINIDKIKNSIQNLGYVHKFKEIKWNPKYWYFYDHWIEIEISDMQLFVFNFETMQTYYFNNKIQIENNYIYSFKNID